MILSPEDDAAFAIGLTDKDRTQRFHSAPFAERLGDKSGSIVIAPRSEETALSRAAVLARLPEGAENTCHLLNMGTVFSMSKFADKRDAPLLVGSIADQAAFTKPCVGARDLLIRPAGSIAASLPTELAQFEQPIRLAIETFDALAPDASKYNVYIQVLNGVVLFFCFYFFIN